MTPAVVASLENDLAGFGYVRSQLGLCTAADDSACDLADGCAWVRAQGDPQTRTRARGGRAGGSGVQTAFGASSHGRAENTEVRFQVGGRNAEV